MPSAKRSRTGSKKADPSKQTNASEKKQVKRVSETPSTSEPTSEPLKNEDQKPSEEERLKSEGEGLSGADLATFLRKHMQDDVDDELDKIRRLADNYKL